MLCLLSIKLEKYKIINCTKDAYLASAYIDDSGKLQEIYLEPVIAWKIWSCDEELPYALPITLQSTDWDDSHVVFYKDDEGASGGQMAAGWEKVSSH